MTLIILENKLSIFQWLSYRKYTVYHRYYCEVYEISDYVSGPINDQRESKGQVGTLSVAPSTSRKGREG